MWLVSVGHEVLFGSRAVDKARGAVDELEKEWGDRVAGCLIVCDNAWVCACLPVVILAVHADSDFALDRLAGEIVASMANNLVKHGNELNAAPPPHGSVAAEIQRCCGALVVRTVFHLGAGGPLRPDRPRDVERRDRDR